MKKSIFFIVCLMAAMTSQVYADEVEIPLFELTQGGNLGGDEPMDDPGQGDTPPIGNYFHATLIDRTLVITSGTTDTSHLMVRSITNGETVINRYFVAYTTEPNLSRGHYALRIQNGDSIFTGRFFVP